MIQRHLRSERNSATQGQERAPHALFSPETEHMSRPELDGEQQLAERIRHALIEAAQAAHTDAGIRGLCCEGAWEAVVSTLRGLDLAALLAEDRATGSPGGAP